MLYDGFLPCDLAIEVNAMTIVVARGRAYNTNDDNQVIHGYTLRSDNIKVSIIEPLNINTYLPYPIEEMITVGDAVSSFIAWPIRLVSLHAQVCYQNESTSSVFN